MNRRINGLMRLTLLVCLSLIGSCRSQASSDDEVNALLFLGGYAVYLDSITCNLINGQEMQAIRLQPAASVFVGSSMAGNLDGIATAASFGHPGDISTDCNGLYIADQDNLRLRRADIRTSQVVSVATFAATPLSITSSSQYVYALLSNQTLVRVDVLTGNIIELASGFTDVRAVALDLDRIFVLEADRVVTVPRDGGSAELLVSGIHNGVDLTTNGNALFWIYEGGSRLRAYALDEAYRDTDPDIEVSEDTLTHLTTDGVRVYAAGVNNLYRMSLGGRRGFVFFPFSTTITNAAGLVPVDDDLYVSAGNQILRID